MKILALFLLLGLVGVLGYNANRLRMGYRSCAVAYQDSLDTIAVQSRTVFADRRGSCLSSFQLFNDWDACVADAQKPVYRPLRPVLSPFVINVMLFFHEQRKDVDQLKREHDERCKSYSELMFFSPEE